MRHVFRGSLVAACAAGAMFGLVGGGGFAQASTTQATMTQASTTQASLMSAVSPVPTHVTRVSFVTPMTNPPGACEDYEYGEWKIGEDGYLYQCQYVDGEGYYWLPV